jgi:hypothetical protein
MLIRSLVNAELKLSGGKTKLIEASHYYEIIKILEDNLVWDVYFQDGSIALGVDSSAFECGRGTQVEKKPVAKPVVVGTTTKKEEKVEPKVVNLPVETE